MLPYSQGLLSAHRNLQFCFTMSKIRPGGQGIFWGSKGKCRHMRKVLQVGSVTSRIIVPVFNPWQCMGAVGSRDIKVKSWPSGKLPFDCQKIAKNLTFFQKMFNKIAIGNFVEKNDNNFFHFLKKCQVFGNFLTFNWQFSGGSDYNLIVYQHYKFYIG